MKTLSAHWPFWHLLELPNGQPAPAPWAREKHGKPAYFSGDWTLMVKSTFDRIAFDYFEASVFFLLRNTPPLY